MVPVKVTADVTGFRVGVTTETSGIDSRAARLVEAAELARTFQYTPAAIAAMTTTAAAAIHLILASGLKPVPSVPGSGSRTVILSSGMASRPIHLTGSLGSAGTSNFGSGFAPTGFL